MKKEQQRHENEKNEDKSVLNMFNNPCQKVENFPYKTYFPNQQKLLCLFRSIQKNDKTICQLNRKLQDNFQKLEKYSTSQEPSDFQEKPKIILKKQEQNQNENDYNLVQKLFGRKKYTYKLQSSEVSDILYKQRNFQISVELQNEEGQSVRNNNVVNLSLGVCTVDGSWLTENKVGEKMLKGRTQVELYEGKALFTKIYIRDISRHFLSGKINLIIYGKPSILKYNATNPYETFVNYNNIQPLIIYNLKVKAKKKD